MQIGNKNYESKDYLMRCHDLQSINDEFLQQGL